MKYRVLVLVPSLDLGGGVTNYYNTLKLDQYDHIRYFPVNRNNTNTLWSKLTSFAEILIRFSKIIDSVELVHVNPSLNMKSFFRDMVFIIFSRIKRKPVIVFFRGWDDQFEKLVKRNVVLRYLFGCSYARADTLIVLDDIFKKKLHELGVNRHIKVYVETTVADSSGIEKFDIIKKNNEMINGSINIVFISRLVKEKGIYIAIDSVNKYIRHNNKTNVLLYIAGEGPELDKAVNYAESNRLDFVKFVGHVSGDEKHELLLKSHIMIFPTYYGEGMPNCILEGMLYGMPIISRSIASIPKVVKNGVNGFVTKSLSSNVFASLIEKATRDSGIYRSMALANHNAAMAKYVTEVVTGRLLDIYENTMESVTKDL